MMKHSRTAFAFTPEFGAKLRALRRQRNLTLRGLAVLMGRNHPGVEAARLPPALTSGPILARFRRCLGIGYLTPNPALNHLRPRA